MDYFTRKETETGVVLNEVQRQAASYADGALLLLASPGSGKTTTLIMRIGYLIESKGVRPSRIKAITFSRASAKDMKERFDRFFPGLRRQMPDFSTIHSLAFEVVRELFHAKRVSYRMIEGAADADNEQWNKTKILRDIYKRLNGDFPTDDQMEELTSYISFIKNKLISPSQLSLAKCDVPKAETIYKEYEKFKQSGAPQLLVDYDDMLTIANDTLTLEPDILKKFQLRYDYVLTDESQDTSLVQHAIVEKLVKSHGNLYVVADDDQSIYTWRAAEPRYLLDFKQAYPMASILKMEQNYRSSRNIVDVANRFIKRNKNRYDKNMFTRNPESKPITITELPDYKYQAKYVVEKISDNDDLNEVAVLYRNNSSSIMLMNALDRAGIPFYMKDGDNRFFSHWVVEDILNFMRMTYNDKRPDILEKIHTKFNGYITKRQMVMLAELSADTDQSVFDRLLNHVPLQEYQIKQLEAGKETFARMQGAKPLAAIQTIRDKLGYDKAIEKMCERLGFRKEYLIGILNTLEEIAESLETMEEFAKRLKFLEQSMKDSKSNKNGSAVTLSTLHSAKGLEFDTVYMVDLVEGILPSNDDIKKFEKDEPDGMEEAVRLFYVGMTRAKQELELLSYKSRDGEQTKISPFVTDVRFIQNPPKEIPGKSPGDSAAKRARRSLPSVPYNQNAIREPAQFAVGKRVRHRVFGSGDIVLILGDSVEIRFPSETKRLSINICIEMGLLEPDA
ncbi:ATP-dependent helicase [Cohnella cholangitidis]|uniref:DNA 3'-5' helicase n=2 Tax=Cohnella cholangitidis TaxID=2598458 RepID=A0A7G5C6Q1_9BACL|nr:ATP-dependent helicase [Cohnella cholangitidis]